MRKAVAIFGFALMAIGLILTAFGTQQTPVSQGTLCDNGGCVITFSPTSVGHCSQGQCQLTLTAQLAKPSPDFTLNFVGMFLAVLGSAFFAAFYPIRPSSTLRVEAISLAPKIPNMGPSR